MRTGLVLLAALLASSANAFAQRNLTELDFNKNRTLYSREQFSEGEDASSGFDYVYFRNRTEIVMIRAIWSATHTRELRIEDMYFGDDGLALYRRSTAQRKSMGVLKTGRSTGLQAKEEMHFENRRLVRWIQDGQAVSKLLATSWLEVEKSTLETAKAWIESYEDLKRHNQ